MKNTSYISLQKKYPGKLVTILEGIERVAASGETVQERN